MKYYSYFPGCSCSTEGGSKAYNWSIMAVSKVLDVELQELDDWNCCGSTPSGSIDELNTFCIASRDLALAEKKGFDLVTPCSACYVIFNRTNYYTRKYPHLKAKVDEALAAGGLAYHGTTRARHILDIFVNDVGYDKIRAAVKRGLQGLKIASYYGCQVVRPKPGFDHPESPQSMDRLVASLGGDPVNFPLKTRCCGGSLVFTEESLALGLMKKIFDSVSSHGGECVVTGCPLCQTNLDVYQSRVNQKFKTDYHIPILFFTQLMGIAFGLSEKELGIGKGVVPAEKVLAKYH